MLVQGEGGASALMKACYFGHRHIAELLLDAGADINMRSTGGELAVRWAQKQGHQHIVALLFERGSKPLPPSAVLAAKCTENQSMVKKSLSRVPSAASQASTVGRTRS